MLTFGNRPDIGIITLWTKKEHVLSKLSKDHYGVVGQLYSRDEGISTLLRSCLANKSIRYLILCGVDLYNSGEALLALSEKGVDNEHKINGTNTFIHKEIPVHAVELFRNNIKVIDCRKTSQLAEFIDTLPKLPSYGAPEHFPNAKVSSIEWEDASSSFKLSSKTVSSIWPQILHLIMNFGITKQTEYGNGMKEVINLMATITDEDPFNPDLHLFNFTKEELEDYIPRILSDLKIKDIEYTYGDRLRKHFGIDQISEITKYLKKVPYTRRALAVTWDVKTDLGNEKAPCLDIVQFMIQNNKLFLTAYFRSNDMFDAWPRNVLALRRLQSNIAKELSLSLGSLTTVSASAHIYESAWPLANLPVEPEFELDPLGNFVISVDGRINVKHFSPSGRLVGEFAGTAAELIPKLLSRVSLLSHALYLGKELEKAEYALKNNLEYMQG